VFQNENIVAKWKCEEKMQLHKFKEIVVTKCKCAKKKKHKCINLEKSYYKTQTCGEERKNLKP